VKRPGRLQRRKPFLARAKPRPKSKRGPAPTPADKSAREAFKLAVCSEPCIGRRIAGHVCEAPLQAMHVVSKQTLKRRGLRHLLWDPVNGVAGCYRIHRRHDQAVEKIPRELLPQRCIDWARTHDVFDSLERHWPTRDTAKVDAFADGTPNAWARSYRDAA
jgi:hypothetical protein